MIVVGTAGAKSNVERSRRRACKHSGIWFKVVVYLLGVFVERPNLLSRPVVRIAYYATTR